MHSVVLNYKIKNILFILYLIVQHNWIYKFNLLAPELFFKF